MIAAEIELRRKIAGRFGGVVFANAGQVMPQLSKISSNNWLFGVGAGVRFQLTKRNPLNYRVDVAYGRNGWIFYFSVSEAF